MVDNVISLALLSNTHVRVGGMLQEALCVKRQIITYETRLGASARGTRVTLVRPLGSGGGASGLERADTGSEQNRLFGSARPASPLSSIRPKRRMGLNQVIHRSGSLRAIKATSTACPRPTFLRQHSFGSSCDGARPIRLALDYCYATSHSSLLGSTFLDS